MIVLNEKMFLTHTFGENPTGMSVVPSATCHLLRVNIATFVGLTPYSLASSRSTVLLTLIQTSLLSFLCVCILWVQFNYSRILISSVGLDTNSFFFDATVAFHCNLIWRYKNKLPTDWDCISARKFFDSVMQNVNTKVILYTTIIGLIFWIKIY